MEENMIKISLEEYKELLLKDKPNNKESMLMDALRKALLENITYYENWQDELELTVKNSDNFKKDIFTIIKVLDNDFYKELIETIYAKKAADDAKELEKSKKEALMKAEKEDN